MNCDSVASLAPEHHSAPRCRYEFTPEAARFFLDGELMHTVHASAIKHGEQNLWVTSIASHMGGTRQVDDGALPQEALCDYVRVFIKSAQAANQPHDANSKMIAAPSLASQIPSGIN